MTKISMDRLGKAKKVLAKHRKKLRHAYRRTFLSRRKSSNYWKRFHVELLQQLFNEKDGSKSFTVDSMGKHFWDSLDSAAQERMEDQQAEDKFVCNTTPGPGR